MSSNNAREIIVFERYREILHQRVCVYLLMLDALFAYVYVFVYVCMCYVMLCVIFG